jgi:hypothetical protein
VRGQAAFGHPDLARENDWRFEWVHEGEIVACPGTASSTTSLQGGASPSLTSPSAPTRWSWKTTGQDPAVVSWRTGARRRRKAGRSRGRGGVSRRARGRPGRLARALREGRWLPGTRVGREHGPRLNRRLEQRGSGGQPTPSGTRPSSYHPRAVVPRRRRVHEDRRRNPPRSLHAFGGALRVPPRVGWRGGARSSSRSPRQGRDGLGEALCHGLQPPEVRLLMDANCAYDVPAVPASCSASRAPGSTSSRSL